MPEEAKNEASLMHLVIRCGERTVMVAPPDLSLSISGSANAYYGVLAADCPACGKEHAFKPWELK